MSKKQFFVLGIVISILIAPFIFAEEKHPINKSTEKCMDESKCITSEMNKCLDKAISEWEVELDKYYNLLMDVLDEEPKKKLKQSQSAWEKFRDLEFEFIPHYFKDIGSYIGPTIWGDKRNVIRARAIQLKFYYEVIKDE